MVITMRFLPFVFLAATFVKPAISDDLFFSDSSPDLSTFQDTPQDLLASQNLPEASTSTDGDEDFFSDSDITDFPLTDASDLYSDLEASCLTPDGQSLNKLRPRDGATICSPQGSTPQSIQRIREAWEKIQKYRDGLWAPEEPLETEPEKPPPPIPPLINPEHPEDSRCPSDFPIHLCCDRRGGIYILDSPIILPENNFIRVYFGCSAGLCISLSFLFLPCKNIR